MDKKILSIFMILVIVVSSTLLYVTLKEPKTKEDQQDFPLGEGPTNEDISNEIDNTFIPDDDEIDIGDMI